MIINEERLNEFKKLNEGTPFIYQDRAWLISPKQNVADTVYGIQLGNPENKVPISYDNVGQVKFKLTEFSPEMQILFNMIINVSGRLNLLREI
jgi:hypothetical protein